MALTLDGNGTMTVGNGDITGLVAGALPSNVIGAGAVLQVVQGTYSTLTSIASTSFTDTGLSLAITPSSASSKILIIVSQPATLTRAANALNVNYQLLRGASSIFDAGRVFGLFALGATEIDATNALNTVFLDSPATTSATTYKTQAKTNTTASSAAVVFQNASGVSSITLMEIAA